MAFGVYQMWRAMVVTALVGVPVHAQQGEVRVIRIPGAESPRATVRPSAQRAVLGLSLEASGAADTAGLFVSQVTPNGPAERAGIIEGDRIAAIDGADLRVPAEDVEDRAVGTARTDRLIRAIAEADSGRPVQLRVVRAGQVRELRVIPEPDTAIRILMGEPLEQEIAGRLRMEGQRLRDSVDGWRLRFEQELPALIERAAPRLEIRMSPSVVRGTRIIV